MLTGILLALYAHPVPGTLDIMSLAGIIVTVLFALIAGSTFKNYYDSLEKLHKELEQKLTTASANGLVVIREDLDGKWKQMEESYGRYNTIIAGNNNANLHYIQELEQRIKKMEDMQQHKQK